jgi:hypothetical protein
MFSLVQFHAFHAFHAFLILFHTCLLISFDILCEKIFVVTAALALETPASRSAAMTRWDLSFEIQAERRERKERKERKAQRVQILKISTSFC